MILISCGACFQILLLRYTDWSQRVAINFLKGIYEVRFYYKVTVPRFRVGRAYRAILDDKTKFVTIDIDNPVASLKKIDEQAEYYALRECKIDPSQSILLINISSEK